MMLVSNWASGRVLAGCVIPFALPDSEVQHPRMTYQLLRLRLPGPIERSSKINRYRPTDLPT